jgi:hypothetical protein
VTLPANPPAIRANPKNNTNFAFHATPLPEYEKLSPDSLVFSIELMTSMPREEQIRGIQSTKVIWIKDALRGEWEYVAASIKKNSPMENYKRSEM